MRAHVIENGIVVNTIEVESLDFIDGLIEANEGGIGWVVNESGKLSPPAKDAQTDKTEYQRQRAAEYPPMTDYLDGVVKNDQAQIQAYIDACLAVKAKYPKPE